MIDDLEFMQAAVPLIDWFEKNARTLPWRSDPTPYHVWISEIMLQQTRVEAVKPYYTRFMEALPDVQALAECPEDVYLKLWEGLGYYSRIRNLHGAAVQVMEEYGGVIPAEVPELLKLKGIGSYTAGAISSIAYGRPVPAVDGNVLRVLSRLTGDDTDITKPSVKSRMEELLAAGLQSEEAQNAGIRANVFNQALMDLGATVCVPNGSPNCEDCPWKGFCRAFREDRTAELPVKKKAAARKIEDKTILVLVDGDKVAVHKRPAKGLLAGLYELPNRPGHLSTEEAIAYVKSIGFNPLRIRSLEDAKHIFSHVEWHMTGYQVLLEEDAFSTPEQKERAAQEKLLFVEAEDSREHYAIPTAFAAYARYMQMRD